ncbi:hypothetical protein BGZ94_000705 [Podila epigama]|nr:hypothetical protein BGZ94_000705 [Podila epigama]
MSSAPDRPLANASISIAPTSPSPKTELVTYPVIVENLPNKGRAYVATRPISPGELIFVADAFGTTMCDAWLDCGICHYCWSLIRNRKDQIKLPTRNSQHKTAQGTVMVFCNVDCWDSYGRSVADMVCRVEQKVRRTWTNTMSKQRLTKSRRDPSSSHKLSPSHTDLIHAALAIADSSKEILNLNDNALTQFLDYIWAAVDTMIEEQQAQVDIDINTSPAKGVSQTSRQESLFPALARHMLSGHHDAQISARISDDDCETTRLVTEILMRHQFPDSSSATTVEATFEDYCAMQSNELTVLRQELRQSIMDEDASTPTSESTMTNGSDSPENLHWRRLVSILPPHLLGCIYMYLRIKNALFLLSFETGDDDEFLPALTIDHATFRAILYREIANSFGIRDASDELLGFAVFPRACFFNHSCRPNVQKQRATGSPSLAKNSTGAANRVRQMEYWSIREIQAGEECCISYGDITPSRKERQQRLEEMYFFHCSCSRCLEEEKEECADV